MRTLARPTMRWAVECGRSVKRCGSGWGAEATTLLVP
jgi:hypothetical protein